jgi:hypothetical protein
MGEDSQRNCLKRKEEGHYLGRTWRRSDLKLETPSLSIRDRNPSEQPREGDNTYQLNGG